MRVRAGGYRSTISSVSGDAASTPGISIDGLTVSYGDTHAVQDLSLSVQEGELVTLLGPSGCGKTTTLRSVAGLERPSRGRVTIGDRVVFSSAHGVDVPVEKRNVSMMFQSYALWPHLSVFENVAYGLRVRKLRGDDLRTRVGAALELVQLGGYSKRPVAALSGGQQQRVALARSIVYEPSVLLFDEPLSNLDARMRVTMRRDLRDVQQKLRLTALYVTHDQEEAFSISDRVVVMNHGRIEQIGSPVALYQRPRTRFVAEFVGTTNLVVGRVLHHDQRDHVEIELDRGARLSATPPLDVPSTPGDNATCVIHASRISLSLDMGAGGEALNSWRGEVVREEFCGDYVDSEVRIEGYSGVIQARRPAEACAMQPGTPVMVCADADDCVIVG